MLWQGPPALRGHAGKMAQPGLFWVVASCLPLVLGADEGTEGLAASRAPGCSALGPGLCGPSVRFQRAAGLLRGTGHLKLMPVAPAKLDTFQAQRALRAVSFPRAVAGTNATLTLSITALAITTECSPAQKGSRDCRCLPDYWWSDSHCKQRQPCGGVLLSFVSMFTSRPCDCLRFPAAETGYCLPLLQASQVTATSTLAPKRAEAEGGLTLSFHVGEGATAVKLYLLNPAWSGAKEIHGGTEVALVLDSAQAVLRLSSVSPDWAGTYVCRYRHGDALRELKQEVLVPFAPEDLLPGPSRVSMNCSSHDRLSLQCCVRARGGRLWATWTPGDPGPVELVGQEDPLCHFLTLDTCPTKDTTYRCTFRSGTEGGLRSVHTAVLVSVIQAGDLFCPSENGTWSATKAGQVAEGLCPKDREGTVLRSCSPGGTWGAVQSNCTSRRLLSGLHKAQLLRAGLGSPQLEVPWQMDWLEEMAREMPEATPQDLLAVVAMMDTLSQVAQESELPLETDVVDSFLEAVNWMLSFDPEADWLAARSLSPQVASRFLQAIENITRLLVPPPAGFSLALANLELHSAQLNSSSVEDYTRLFGTEPPVRLHIAEEELAALVRQEGSVTVTSLVLKKLDRILPGGSGPPSHLGSLVMSTAVVTANGSVREIEMGMMFGHRNSTREEGRVAQCVFWDYRLLGGEGGWSSQGCQASSGDTATNCTCYHLTSFSILMSAGPVPSSFALTFLSTFGTWASILALVASLAIYYLVWPAVVKNKVAYLRYTTLVNIALSLLAGSICFLAVAQLTADHESALCVAAAFFTHFFYLAMFFWMLVQALFLLHRLIFVFHQPALGTITPVMVAVGFLCPLAVAAATVAGFFPKRAYIQEKLCWLRAESKALYAFSVPILVIVGVNLMILFVVLLKLMRPSVSEGPPGEEKAALLGIFKALLILTPVFGLTWGLGAITMMAEASEFSHYAFTVLNSLQGVFILVFGCLMDKKVREALWKRLCSSPVATRMKAFQSKSDTLDSHLSK